MPLDFDCLPLDFHFLYSTTMSDLYRSAISARIAKLPPPTIFPDEDVDEEGEGADTIGNLPGSGLGPPAMQVEFR